jgi:3-oxoacyl-[acyl-carrier protein] reductase
MDNKKTIMNQSALVTGGSRGIGLEVARELARAGFNLAINGVRETAQVTDTLEGLRSHGTRVIYARGDISNARDRKAVFQDVLGALGQLNVLVNNAGIPPPRRKDILMADEESYDRVMDVNLKGPYFLTQMVANYMVDSKKANRDFRACIINISSISARVASVERGEYCISKAGVSMATRLWAARLGEFDIPVYEIQPGIIKTDMTAGAEQKYDELIGKGVCLQARWGMPEDVAKVAVAMATGSLPYSTGQVVAVDGGLTIPRL